MNILRFVLLVRGPFQDGKQQWHNESWANCRTTMLKASGVVMFLYMLLVTALAVAGDTAQFDRAVKAVIGALPPGWTLAERKADQFPWGHQWGPWDQDYAGPKGLLVIAKGVRPVNWEVEDTHGKYRPVRIATESLEIWLMPSNYSDSFWSLFSVGRPLQPAVVVDHGPIKVYVTPNWLVLSDRYFHEILSKSRGFASPGVSPDFLTWNDWRQRLREAVENEFAAPGAKGLSKSPAATNLTALLDRTQFARAEKAVIAELPPGWTLAERKADQIPWGHHWGPWDQDYAGPKGLLLIAKGVRPVNVELEDTNGKWRPVHVAIESLEIWLMPSNYSDSIWSPFSVDRKSKPWLVVNHGPIDVYARPSHLLLSEQQFNDLLSKSDGVDWPDSPRKSPELLTWKDWRPRLRKAIENEFATPEPRK